MLNFYLRVATSNANITWARPQCSLSSVSCKKKSCNLFYYSQSLKATYYNRVYHGLKLNFEKFAFCLFLSHFWLFATFCGVRMLKNEKMWLGVLVWFEAQPMIRSLLPCVSGIGTSVTWLCGLDLGSNQFQVVTPKNVTHAKSGTKIIISLRFQGIV